MALGGGNRRLCWHGESCDGLGGLHCAPRFWMCVPACPEQAEVHAHVCVHVYGEKPCLGWAGRKGVSCPKTPLCDWASHGGPQTMGLRGQYSLQVLSKPGSVWIPMESLAGTHSSTGQRVPG